MTTTATSTLTDHAMSNPPTVALLGHTGNSNLGDEAITESVIANLTERLPGVQFKLFTIVPEDSLERHGFASYPLRPTEANSVTSVLYRNWQFVDTPSAHSKAPLFEREGWSYTQVEWRPTWKQRLRQLYNVVTKLPAIIKNERAFDKRNEALLKDVDLLIFTGSNQFLDNFGGPWAFPFTLMRWSRLAKKMGKPIAFASIGAGPIYSHTSLKLIRKALSTAAYVSVRDKPSKTLLLKAGCEEPIHVLPDLAFSLPERVTKRQTDWARPTIAINPMPIYASYYWYVADTKQYNNFVHALADVAISLKAKGFPFFFFATQTRDERVMDDVFVRLKELGHDDLNQKELTRVSPTVEDLQHVIGSADVVVATRFHGTVIGLHSKKLVLSTSYYRKAADVLDEFGLNDYAFQIEDLSAEELLTKIDQIITRQAQHQPQIEAQQHNYHTQLDQQYQQLCDLLKR